MATGSDLRPATWEDVIRHEAKQARVPPELALAIAETESGFDPRATSPKGARGIFQLMPATAAELGVDPNDPVQNIRGGLTYFRKQLDAHGGDVQKALQAYNWGPGNVAKGGQPPAETQQYVSRIMSRLPARPPQLPVQTLQQVNQQIGQPPPGAPSGQPVEGPSLFDKGIVQSVLESVDPRTPTGRRNIAGGLGAAAGTAAVVGTAPVTAPVIGLGAVTAGALGAMGGGFTAEAGEQLAGTAPPSTSAVLGAGAEQAAYDVAGNALLWPIKLGGRWIAATKVGKYASEHFDTALTGARDAVKWAREAARTAVEDARGIADLTVRTTKQAAESAVSRATSFAESGVEAVRSRFNQVATAPPTVTPRVAGQRAQAVIEGPARAARDEIGQMVEEAARSGPDVDIRALKEEAHRILAEEIQPSQQAFPRPGAGASPVDETIEQLQQASRVQLSPEELATRPPSQRAAAQAIQDALVAAQKEQVQTVLKHPAMGILGRILNAADTVPFYAAHQFKRELDEAIGTAWDRSVRNRVINISKTLRGTLRDALGSHEPYAAATRAYQSIAPLYTKGLAPRLRKAAIDAPEVVIRLLKGNDPTKAAMLRDLLVSQPEQVGAGRQGQHAWDSIRSAWTHENLIKGPLEKLDDRIAKMDPEFAEIMYGDGPGSTVLENLRQISAAFRQATEAGEATIRESKAVAKGAIAAARQETKAQVRGVVRQGREMVGRSLNAMEAAKAEAKKFAKSSLVGAKDMEALSDALRAGGLGVGSIWGAQSIARLILRGPKGADLLRYAAYSPQGTQLLVKALTSSVPGPALADLLRLSGVGDFIREGAGAPPPQEEPSLVGAPPP